MIDRRPVPLPGNVDNPKYWPRFGGAFLCSSERLLMAEAVWTSLSIQDTPKPRFEAPSNASGLTPPRWLWRPRSIVKHFAVVEHICSG
jgi:hypothetical protein